LRDVALGVFTLFPSSGFGNQNNVMATILRKGLKRVLKEKHRTAGPSGVDQ
jgi:hypothetical protein